MEHLKDRISGLIQECRSMRLLKQIHSQIITSPHLLRTHNYFLTARLLFLCAISDWGSLSYATDVFRLIQNPGVSVYNVMIRAYACKDIRVDGMGLWLPIILYKQMLRTGIAPNYLTFPFLVKESAKRDDTVLGLSVHGHVAKFGFDGDIFVQNSLISFYSACGFMSSARKLFDGMLNRDIVSWNSLITGYLRSGEIDSALNLFRRMEERNVITWNSTITGLVQAGRPKDAIEYFFEMQVISNDTVRPDKITVASVLAACASLGAIDHGKWVHGDLKRSGLECDMVIGTALVDMYGKCGCVDSAFDLFRKMPKKDVLAWTTMISAFALHGFGKEAFDLLEEMGMEGVKPNHVTFVGLLSACAHSGLVEEGLLCFELMRHAYLIEPQVHHYACIVDLLSRAGLFEEAERFIRHMPMQPDVFVWGALLGGCQMHGNVELGEKVAQYLIDLDPSNHAFYVILCDLYGKAGRFDDLKRVRALMKQRGIKKAVPGCSMIEIFGVVYEFSVTGSPEVVMEEVEWVLNGLSNEMKMEEGMHGTI